MRQAYTNVLEGSPSNNVNVISIIPSIQPNIVYIPANEDRFDIKRNINSTPKSRIYLSIDTVQKMICRFLTEKKMSEAGLAKILGISIKNLKLLLLKEEVFFALIPKINLPLIKLYCKTKFKCLQK